MVPRPKILLESYLESVRHDKIRCRGYTAPPGFGGEFIKTIKSETCFGPVEETHSTEEFESVLVKGYWINVWSKRNNGTNYALEVPFWVIMWQKGNDWEHQWNDQNTYEPDTPQRIRHGHSP